MTSPSLKKNIIFLLSLTRKQKQRDTNGYDSDDIKFHYIMLKKENGKIEKNHTVSKTDVDNQREMKLII